MLVSLKRLYYLRLAQDILFEIKKKEVLLKFTRTAIKDLKEEFDHTRSDMERSFLF